MLDVITFIQLQFYTREEVEPWNNDNDKVVTYRSQVQAIESVTSQWQVAYVTPRGGVRHHLGRYVNTMFRVPDYATKYYTRGLVFNPKKKKKKET